MAGPSAGVNEAPARRPGGLARFACLVAAALAFLEIFATGFPPASRDRLPVLALAGGLALAAAWDRRRGLSLFAFLFPLAGLGDRLAGGSDAIAWPILLFLGLAGGWTFRFLYDFESLPDPSRADRVLKLLLVLWTMAAVLAVVRARTLWAILRGLRLRAVNVNGLSDVSAIRTSLLSFAVLAGGAAFFFLLRRAGRPDRERALVAALGGAAVSAAVAVAERLGLVATETSGFWKATGRLSGGAVDPNALGILCGGAVVVAAALAASSAGPRRAIALPALPLLAAGLALSGSRSGFGLAVVGLLALLLARGIPMRRRLAAVAAAALVAAGAAVYLAAAGGSTGARVLQTFDSRVPFEYRMSTRPVFWTNAVRLFLLHPVEGAGLGAFTWQLPNLLAEEGRSLPIGDNPGNAYLQALAETGVFGFALTVALVVIVGREAWRAVRARNGAGLDAGAGAALLGFLVSLLTGSHWLSPDVAFFFFLMAAGVARPPAAFAPARGARALQFALGVYALAALWAAASTDDPAEAFRYRSDIGFHETEAGGRGPFRWTQRRFALRVPAGERVSLTLAHYTPENRSVTLDANAEGRRVLERELAPGDGIRLALTAPAGEPRVFRFVLSRAFVPRRLGTSTDGRELGVVAFGATGR